MSDEPIRVGHPDFATLPDATCGCCNGTALSTLQPTANRPSLSAISFRPGNHTHFKASMKAALASSAYPALSRLGTRDDDDFSIALIDAWASACDVLSFYQQQHANEAYVGTSTERFSITELSRLIGYRPHPGSAAEADLVMLMDDPPGAEAGVTDLTIPEGTRVQSLPGPEETPQVFETLAALTARVAWNTLRPRQSRRVHPELDDTHMWVAGSGSGLKKGDAVLIVGRRRADPDASDYWVNSNNWDFRFVDRLEHDLERDTTKVVFDRPLGSHIPLSDPARKDHQFFIMRQRVSLFGYNAPDPRMLAADTRTAYGYASSADRDASVIIGSSTNVGDWLFQMPAADAIMLDQVRSEFVEGDWVVLASKAYRAELYRIVRATEDGRTQWGMSGRSTRLDLDTSINLFHHEDAYRSVSVYGENEELEIADHPLTGWISGTEIELSQAATDLPSGRALLLSGRRARVEVAVTEVALIDETSGETETVSRGTRLTLVAEPIETAPGSGVLRFDLQSDDGFRGISDLAPVALVPVAAEDGAEVISEAATLDYVLDVDEEHSALVLVQSLAAPFDRASLQIHANVARVAHGEGATDILGGGQPRDPFQTFALQQSPVTQRLAATETGVASTLTVRVDGVAWQEVPDLYHRAATDRVYKTVQTDAGETIVQFGDGLSGARPAAGRDNIVAEYSRGIGTQGNVRAGQLTLPLDRPLGLSATSNPLPAVGGDNPENTDVVRYNAPIYTRTLGRVVSITDYRDFALGFPGISKALAGWVWQGQTRRIVVTVAGPDGAQVPAGSATLEALLGALKTYGDPLAQVDVMSYAPAHFRLGLRVAVDPTYETNAVLGDLDSQLRQLFSFDERDFAQSVALSEVAAAAHTVAGVVAVDIDQLYRETAPQTAAFAHARLQSLAVRQGAGDTLLPAEVLTLSPDPLDKLEAMT